MRDANDRARSSSACQPGDLRWSTPPFGDARETSAFASTTAKRAASRQTGERRMAKAPPSAKRDRSVIRVAALVATYRPEQLVSHLTRAIDNGVTQEEITEVITHMAFYAGWPAAMSAAQVAYTVLVEDKDKGQ